MMETLAPGNTEQAAMQESVRAKLAATGTGTLTKPAPIDVRPFDTEDAPTPFPTPASAAAADCGGAPAGSVVALDMLCSDDAAAACALAPESASPSDAKLLGKTLGTVVSAAHERHRHRTTVDHVFDMIRPAVAGALRALGCVAVGEPSPRLQLSPTTPDIFPSTATKASSEPLLGASGGRHDAGRTSVVRARLDALKSSSNLDAQDVKSAPAEDGSPRGARSNTAAALSEEEQNDHEAAEALMLFGRQGYTADDLHAADEEAPTSAAPDARADSADLGMEFDASGRRGSKRKRTPNPRITDELEPSPQEKNWGKGRGRRAKALQDKHTDKRAKESRGDDASTEAARTGSRRPRNGDPDGGADDEPLLHPVGPPVTLELLRMLRDLGRSIVGMEVLVQAGPDPAGGDPEWLRAKVHKCDLDFRKVVVRAVDSGVIIQLNWHKEGTSRRVCAPPPEGMRPVPLMGMLPPPVAPRTAGGPLMGLKDVALQQELRRRLQMAELAAQQPMSAQAAAQLQHLMALRGIAMPPAGSGPRHSAPGRASAANTLQSISAALAGARAPAPWPSTPSPKGSQHASRAHPNPSGGLSHAELIQSLQPGGLGGPLLTSPSRRGFSDQGAARPYAARTSPAATIANVLGLKQSDIGSARNPQVKLQATMFKSLYDHLSKMESKVMCKVCVSHGLRTAVLTGVDPPCRGLLCKYLDGASPVEDVITESEIQSQRVAVEITQVISIHGP